MAEFYSQGQNLPDLGIVQGLAWEMASIQSSRNWVVEAGDQVLGMVYAQEMGWKLNFPFGGDVVGCWCHHLEAQLEFWRTVCKLRFWDSR